MQQITEAELLRACRTLFGPELKLSRDFLAYLQPAGARTAYRKQAKIIHPDRFAISSTTIKRRQQKLFQDLNQAHETIQRYLRQKQLHQAKPYVQKRPATGAGPQRQRTDSPQQHGGTRILPRRPLQFGQFLYAQGIISFQVLIAAITWQRRQRPALGEIARRWGWLDDQGIQRIITTRAAFQRFGERAEHLGLLSSLQVRTLLFHQRANQQKIGDYFVEQGIINAGEKNRLLTLLAEHNRTYRHGFNQHDYYFHR